MTFYFPCTELYAIGITNWFLLATMLENVVFVYMFLKKKKKDNPNRNCA